LQLATATFTVSEQQTITFPAQFVTGSTYRINLFGATFPVGGGNYTFDANDPSAQITAIIDAYANMGISSFIAPNQGANIRQYTIDYQDVLSGVTIPSNTQPGLSVTAVSPANAITVSTTRAVPATTQQNSLATINRGTNGDVFNPAFTLVGGAGV